MPGTPVEMKAAKKETIRMKALTTREVTIRQPENRVYILRMRICKAAYPFLYLRMPGRHTGIRKIAGIAGCIKGGRI